MCIFPWPSLLACILRVTHAFLVSCKVHTSSSSAGVCASPTLWAPEFLANVIALADAIFAHSGHMHLFCFIVLQCTFRRLATAFFSTTHAWVSLHVASRISHGCACKAHQVGCTLSCTRHRRLRKLICVLAEATYIANPLDTSANAIPALQNKMPVVFIFLQYM